MLLMYGLLICQHEINQMDIVTWWCIGQDLHSWGIINMMQGSQNIQA
jgi:hypothetical protein